MRMGLYSIAYTSCRTSISRLPTSHYILTKINFWGSSTGKYESWMKMLKKAVKCTSPSCGRERYIYIFTTFWETNVGKSRRHPETAWGEIGNIFFVDFVVVSSICCVFTKTIQVQSQVNGSSLCCFLIVETASTQEHHH